MSKLLKYMLNKRVLPVLLLFLTVGIFIGVRSFGNVFMDPPGKYEKILHNVGDMLREIHFSPKTIDDQFSKTIFDKFLMDRYVDENKNILLRSDIEALKMYENTIDDEILGAPVKFVPAVSAIIKNRILEVNSIYKEILAQPFDFNKDDSVKLDPEKYDFPASPQERHDQWSKRLKSMVLDRYADLLENRESNKAVAGFEMKSDEVLEKEARERVKKIMDRFFERLILKVNDDDRFNDFVNIITETMDPHTSFFPPVDKRYFDEQMSGRFFGIGASLREEDGNIKIGSIIAGSPAWKSEKFTVGDIVLKVGQGADEPVELTGFVVEDAVKIIRGKKGTEVRLTLKKANGTVLTVPIIRDEIVQDETFARSAVINTPQGKIGFIYLPEFYADFENPKGAHCSEDVKKELIKLKEQQVDGIVMDLRYNGGGSLYDVVQMVGYFIEDGPIVQVKDREGRPQIFHDRDRSVIYDGPLAVMVNEFSASASEIFAAAIQDYKRGVVIGSTSTYGKGTVQRSIGLDQILGMGNGSNELGSIKLTLQKFYRVNGGTTQMKGVSSDIVLPDLYEYYKIREKDNKDALPWDEVQRAIYSPWKYAIDYNLIKKSSAIRINASKAFGTISKNAKWISDQNDKVNTLQLKKYLEEQKALKKAVKEVEAATKVGQELQVVALDADLKKLEYDNGKLERFKQWIKNLKSDIYLGETVNVVNDMVNQSHLVYKK